MKIYDGFAFNDELDLLELRLETLDHIVDAFVIVELPFNFRQTPKPLAFADNQVRFERWAHKIRYIKTAQAQIPVAPHPSIEHFQRRQIAKGFLDAQPGDFLLIGDVDEIPDPKAVLEIVAAKPDHPTTLVQKLYYYHVNRHVMDGWSGTVVMPVLPGKEVDCEHIRQLRFHFPKKERGGWHFSWLGSAEQLANKVRSIDVQRDAVMYNSPEIICPDPEDLEFLEKCRSDGSDIFRRDFAHQLIPVVAGVDQPAGIRPWLDLYPHYEATP